MADRRPLRAVPLTVVLAICAVGVVLVALDHWRRGSGVLAAGVGVAAALRLMVPERFIGPMAVRSRAFDVVFLILLAALLVAGTIGF